MCRRGLRSTDRVSSNLRCDSWAVAGSGGTRAAFAANLRQPALRRAQLAWAASLLGHVSITVAVSVYAYDVGGATAVSLVYVLRLVPAAVATPFASLLGDRFDRSRVMLVSNLSRFVLSAVLAGRGARRRQPLGRLCAQHCDQRRGDAVPSGPGRASPLARRAARRADGGERRLPRRSRASGSSPVRPSPACSWRCRAERRVRVRRSRLRHLDGGAAPPAARARSPSAKTTRKRTSRSSRRCSRGRERSAKRPRPARHRRAVHRTDARSRRARRAARRHGDQAAPYRQRGCGLARRRSRCRRDARRGGGGPVGGSRRLTPRVSRRDRALGAAVPADRRLAEPGRGDLRVRRDRRREHPRRRRRLHAAPARGRRHGARACLRRRRDALSTQARRWAPSSFRRSCPAVGTRWALVATGLFLPASRSLWARGSCASTARRSHRPRRSRCSARCRSSRRCRRLRSSASRCSLEPLERHRREPR